MAVIVILGLGDGSRGRGRRVSSIHDFYALNLITSFGTRDVSLISRARRGIAAAVIREQ